MLVLLYTISLFEVLPTLELHPGILLSTPKKSLEDLLQHLFVLEVEGQTTYRRQFSTVFLLG